MIVFATILFLPPPNPKGGVRVHLQERLSISNYSNTESLSPLWGVWGQNTK